MSDFCRIVLAGNLLKGWEVSRLPDGRTVGLNLLGVGHLGLGAGGEPALISTAIPLAVLGRARAQALQQTFGPGGRCMVEGTIEQWESEVVEELPRADGLGSIAVVVTRPQLLVIITTMLNAALPALP